jgi:3D (Asp-Asp-Asp) domain-containing protein
MSNNTNSSSLGEDPLLRSKRIWKPLGAIISGLFFLNVFSLPLKSPVVEGSLAETIQNTENSNSQIPSKDLNEPEKINVVDKNFLFAPSQPQEKEDDNYIPVVVTGYSSSIEETDDTPYLTASGSQVRDGIVAVNFLPFGTKIRFPYLYPNKIFVVEDRMHERFSLGRVDIWFPEKSQAISFGVKKTFIEIVD